LIIWDVIAAFAGSFLTLSVLSMLWKDNPCFKFGQQGIIGIVIANSVLVNMKSLFDTGIKPLVAGRIVLIVPLVLGLLLYTRLSKEYAWLSKYPTSAMVGVGTGVMIMGTLRGQVIDQVKKTVLDVFTATDAMGTFNCILIFIGVVSSIAFWIFTKEHTGGLGIVSKIGRIYLMVSLGANWAGEHVWYLTQVLARLAFVYDNLIMKVLLGQG